MQLHREKALHPASFFIPLCLFLCQLLVGKLFRELLVPSRGFFSDSQLSVVIGCQDIVVIGKKPTCGLGPLERFSARENH